MERNELQAANLDERRLGILKDAEAAINRQAGSATNPEEEIYLIAFKRKN